MLRRTPIFGAACVRGRGRLAFHISAQCATFQPPNSASLPASPQSNAPVSSKGVGNLVPGVPDSAAAGLSDEYRKVWAERISKGDAIPVVWHNPAAYGQLGKLSDQVVYALPPPPPPRWPMRHSEYTWKYTKAYMVALFVAGLAIYLHAKNRIKGSVRLELERRYPMITQILASAGVIQDYSNLEGSLDRELLFRRIYHRLAPRLDTQRPTAAAVPDASAQAAPVSRGWKSWFGFGSTAAATAAPAPPSPATDAVEATTDASIPISRALAVLAHLLGEGEQALQTEAGAQATAAHDVHITPRLAAALAAAGLARPTADGRVVFPAEISADAFIQLLQAGCRDMPNHLLHIASETCFGLQSLSAADTLSSLEEVYDKLVAYRAQRKAKSGAAYGSRAASLTAPTEFSALSLAEVCGDIGFLADPSHAYAFLRDSAAALAGSVDLPAPRAEGTANDASKAEAPPSSSPSTASAGAANPYAIAVPLQRREFAEYLLSAAAEAQVDEARIPNYAKVFALLHLTGMREEAGVKGLN